MLGGWLWAADARAAIDLIYLQELLDRAAMAELAQQREWQTLLHYRSGASGWVSDVDDPRFFLAPDGKTDPRAELAATLRFFFVTDPVGGDPQPAQCAFIARYRWLKSRLNFDGRRLPARDCARFRQWFRELDVGSVTLVFASAYLNNPASLFGHTFLRLDRRGQTERTRLLAYAVNYAADDSGSTVLSYALDGLSGRFRGQFHVQPYDQLVRTYSDLESRDIWEYRLNLDAPQRRRLLEHIWELRQIHFDYYFLRENCAWQMLALLEAADPALALSDRFALWALPADTLRRLDQKGRLGKAAARPARGTVIARRYQALTPEERRWAQRLRSDPDLTETPAFARLKPQRRALLLELALDERQYRRADKIEKGREPPPDESAHRLLIARSRLADSATPVPVEPYATRPDSGHASRRIGFGIGQRDGAEFVEFSARAIYHDLLDADAGYTPHAQIESLDAAVRFYQSGGRLALERLTLLDITSLAPVNTLIPRPSWRIHAGWEASSRTGCRDCVALDLSAGLGMAAESRWPWRTVWFALPGIALEQGNHFAGDHRVGWSLDAGLLSQPTPAWKLLAGARWRDYRRGETGTALRWELRQRVALDRNWAAGLDWRYGEGSHQFGLGLYLYF
ncbi:MAG: DUF4105 domain-containing protein [Candidatus Competibacteraceae bacterium]|nr:DUF4105 domain-containing protein [Candidatus Competibacteraceae bacterium]